MPDFTPNFIAHSEIIGDTTSSEYNLGYLPARFTDRNVSTNILSKTIMNVLDFFLMIILLPLTAFQKAYENDHLMVMLRVIFEVTLELTMWLVLAGVSILTSAALIFDDLYSGKSGSDGYRRLVKNYADETVREDESQPHSNTENNFPAENECPEETVQSLPNHQDWLSSPFPHNYVRDHSETNSKSASYAAEEDEECVNFSFYKPLRSRLGKESADRQRKK